MYFVYLELLILPSGAMAILELATRNTPKPVSVF